MSEAHYTPPCEAAETDDASPRRGGSRRNREFRRYAEAVAGLRHTADGQVAVSSRDLSLTAYAQLVALRLKAKRGIISLFDKDKQYILAEATQTLSLQQDEVHNLSDQMWFGASVLERTDKDFYRQSLKTRRYFEVNDLLSDDRYVQHPAVINEPHGRAFAGVPIITPSNYAIGVLSFLDDHRREAALTDEEVAFMQDVAKAVMAHLEGSRTIVRHARSVKMVQGISRFVEGKSDAEEEPESNFRDPTDMLDRQTAKTSTLHASRRMYAMNATTNAERMDEYQRSYNAPSDDESHGKLRHFTKTTKASAKLLPNSGRSEDGSDATATLSKKSSLDVQGGGMSQEITRCFERAAAVINSSMTLAGTLFLDASSGELSALAAGSESASSPESDGSKSENSQAAATVEPQNMDTSKMKPCRHIASAYDLALAGEQKVLHRPIPERFLKSLMRRFPYGKIWNIDSFGSTSSDEFSESSGTADNTAVESERPIALKRAAKPKRSKRDGATIAELFPGVRSLALMPMYDSTRERYFAASIVWTYDPIRTLTMQDDANYLGAFCDVIMAEVGRLEAELEAQSKTRFISSISHELRTPLHGILGGVECLQDKDSASVQDDMLQMIESSGKSLLDIVNHLLEHAHASSREHRTQKPNKTFRSREIAAANAARPSNTRYNTGTQHQASHDIALLTEEVLDTALWSTPRPSPLSSTLDRRSESSNTSPVKVILEVDPRAGDAGWSYRVNSGAWRRIVQNLVTNSLKYTDLGGYLKLSLSSRSQDEDGPDSGKTVVELTCTDSGRGMSSQYLKYGLWRTFSQEDSQAQGTGLGLSLVHGMVKEMHGKIHVQSSKGVGTAIRVTVPLTRAPQRFTPENDSNPEEWIIKERLRGCRYTTVGFGDDDGGGKRAIQASDVLKESIAAACKSYGMRPTEPGETAHIYILPEHKAAKLASSGPQNDFEKVACEHPTIVLCHSVASSRTRASDGKELANAVHVAQPLGPRKLLRALTSCLEKLPFDALIARERSQQDSSTMDVSGPSSQGPQHVHDRTVNSYKRKSPDDADIESPSRARGSSFSASRRSPSRQPDGSSLKLRTLLVDDNVLNLRLLKTYMRKHGHSFVCAENGVEAVTAYKEAYFAAVDSRTPLLVLMDLTMPVMGGLEATRHIRAFEREQAHTARSATGSADRQHAMDETNNSRRSSLSSTSPPAAIIVALTAMAGQEVKTEALGSGVDLFLTKPVGFKALGEILEGVLKDARR